MPNGVLLGDVTLHVFDLHTWAYYDLERLWGNSQTPMGRLALCKLPDQLILICVEGCRADGREVRKMNVLVILNDPPYGTERSYNGLRLAGSLAKRDDEQVRVFLIGDAAACAKGGSAGAEGLLQHRDDAERCKSTRRNDRRVWLVHGCSRHHGRRARRGVPPQQPQRVNRLDTVGRPCSDVLTTTSDSTWERGCGLRVSGVRFFPGALAALR